MVQREGVENAGGGGSWAMTPLTGHPLPPNPSHRLGPISIGRGFGQFSDPIRSNSIRNRRCARCGIWRSTCVSVDPSCQYRHIRTDGSRSVGPMQVVEEGKFDRSPRASKSRSRKPAFRDRQQCQGTGIEGPFATRRWAPPSRSATIIAASRPRPARVPSRRRGKAPRGDPYAPSLYLSLPHC